MKCYRSNNIAIVINITYLMNERGNIMLKTKNVYQKLQFRKNKYTFKDKNTRTSFSIFISDHILGIYFNKIRGKDQSIYHRVLISEINLSSASFHCLSHKERNKRLSEQITKSINNYLDDE